MTSNEANQNQDPVAQRLLEFSNCEFDRRKFMKMTGSGLGALSLLPFLSWGVKPNMALGAPILGQKRMAVINLYGGNDGLNTVIPTSLSRYYDRRPNIAISNGAALSLTGGPGNSQYRLHPNLTNLRTLWNEGSVAIINRVGYPNMNGSHFVSQDIWSYGIRDGFAGLGINTSGWTARFADLYTETSTGVIAVGVGNRRDFVGANSNRPLVLDSVGGFDYDPDTRFRRNHDYRRQVVAQMLNQTRSGAEEKVRIASNQANELFELVQQAEADYTSAVTYQNRQISRRLKDLAIMIQGGFETRLFYTGFGGFDTHSAQVNRHNTLMTDLNDAIGSFADDMKAMNVWDDVALVIMSEFGRRNFENGSAGTDHGRANVMFVIGGGVQGGMYGPDLSNSDLDQNNLGYEIDFRTVYKAVLEQHLGVDPNPIFPEAVEKLAGPGVLFA